MVVVAEDPDKGKAELGSSYIADFNQWHSSGVIGETYNLLAEEALQMVKSWSLKDVEKEDIARDAALDAWKHLANRHHQSPVHLCNEIGLCLRQKIGERVKRSRSMKTFGTFEELNALGFRDGGDGGISNTIFRLDVRHKLKHDLADFRSKLATECLMRQLLTIREIQDYAGFSNYQARGLKEIMTNFMEDYCGIS